MPWRHTPAYQPADLTTCDREPIHVPGAIQPHGVLLVVDAETFRVVMASATAKSYLGTSRGDVLGASLDELLGDEAGRRVVAALGQRQLDEALHLRLDGTRGEWAGQDVDVLLHRSGHRFVVEIEPGAEYDTLIDAYRLARAATTRLTATNDVTGLCHALASEIRRLSGFDRVMVYRFDAEWNGEVVAEDRREDLNSFFGLHYPASDIPAQARRLYTVNWSRLIADIGYLPVPLDPMLDPDTDKPLDMSFSVLRSVSPIHLEYLSHMGVTASMSVSLVVDGQLWGLVACHHYSGPHRPPYEVRAASEFVGQVAAQLVGERVRATERVRQMDAQRSVARLMADLVADPLPPHDALMASPAVLELVEATGVALHAEGRLLTAGAVPPPAVIHRIAATLEPDGRVRSSDNLAALDPSLAGHDDVAAGALCVSTTAERWLLWFRPAQDRVVDWGGDPHNKALAAAEGPEVRLSPRRSFEKWREVVRGRSEPWSEWQHEVAEQLRASVASLLVQRSREQITLAETVQRQVVLGRSPEVPGFEVGVQYRPAAHNHLGGDWCDAVKLPDGRAAFVVGDVAGHGFRAASTMTQIRTAVRAYLLEGHSPGSCLDKLDHLVASTMDGVTATAAVLVVDVATGDATVASAGHPSPLLVHDGVAESVDVPTRPLLGVGVPDRSETTLSLHDQIVVMFTDGLVERRGTDLDHSVDALARLVASGPGDAGLDVWSEALLTSVDAPDAEAADDRTLLVLRRRAER